MRRYAGFLIIVALGASLIAWYVLRTHRDPRDVKRETEARLRARFAACMLGQPANERYDRRLRAVMVASHDDPTWPKRCIPYGNAALKATGENGTVEPYLSSGNLFDPVVTTLLSPRSVDVDFAAATREVPRPREPTMPTDLPRLHASFVEEATGETDLAVMLGREVACRFAPKDGGLEPIARCSFVADGVRRDRRPELVKGSGEILLHDYRTVTSWRTGTKLLERPLEVKPTRSGNTLLAIAQSKRPTLVVLDGGAPRDVALDRPATTTGEVALAGDQLVWYERGHVFARALLPAVGPVVDLGPAPAGIIRQSCTASSTVAAVLDVDGKEQWQLALRVGDRWTLSAPIPVTNRSRLHCQADRAVVMTVDHEEALTVQRVDCTPAGCTPASVEMRTRAGEVAAVPDGNDVVLVWAHEAVWMVRAPLVELPKAKRIALSEGYAPSVRFIPNSPLVQGLAAYVRGVSTIVLLQSSGTLAVHVRDGRVEPVRAIYE